MGGGLSGKMPLSYVFSLHVIDYTEASIRNNGGECAEWDVRFLFK